MKVRIVLVEPHEAGNVGAAARAMKNFGFDDLVIAGRRQQRLDEISDWWASGAEDLANNARRVQTLEEAIADCHLSVATTAVKTRDVSEELAPSEVARVAEETLGESHTLAVVFGREEFGLTANEIAKCQRTASIPTSPDFPTLNLAQSVAIFCYELAKGLRPRRPDPAPAKEDLLQRLHQRVQRILLLVGFLNEESPDHIYNELRALAGRAALTQREVAVLMALTREIERRLGLAAPGLAETPPVK